MTWKKNFYQHYNDAKTTFIGFFIFGAIMITLFVIYRNLLSEGRSNAYAALFMLFLFAVVGIFLLNQPVVKHSLDKITFSLNGIQQRDIRLHKQIL